MSANAILEGEKWVASKWTPEAIRDGSLTPQPGARRNLKPSLTPDDAVAFLAHGEAR